MSAQVHLIKALLHLVVGPLPFPVFLSWLIVVLLLFCFIASKITFFLIPCIFYLVSPKCRVSELGVFRRPGAEPGLYLACRAFLYRLFSVVVSRLNGTVWLLLPKVTEGTSAQLVLSHPGGARGPLGSFCSLGVYVGFDPANALFHPLWVKGM